MSGARTIDDRWVTGIISPPGSKDEWIVVLDNGQCRTYALERKSGSYQLVRNYRPFKTSLRVGQGIYDSATKSLYDVTYDGRLAWMSFTPSSRPKIEYVKCPMKLVGTLTTFSGGRWIADAVPENKSGPAYVVWFEKTASGKPIYRFVSHLALGAAFIGLSDPSQQSRLLP